MMRLEYDEQVDAASVYTGDEIVPGGEHHKEQIDADRLIRYSDIDGSILEYEFLNVKRYGVRLDDLKHRPELSALFANAGFQERDWSTPKDAGIRTVRRRDRSSAAG
jgi:hypothetical protein